MHCHPETHIEKRIDTKLTHYFAQGFCPIAWQQNFQVSSKGNSELKRADNFELTSCHCFQTRE